MVLYATASQEPIKSEIGELFFVRIAFVFAFAAVAASAQMGPVGASGQTRPPAIKMSPTLNVLDVDQDGIISAAELANAPRLLLTLDKNGDGKLSLEEAGQQRIVRTDRPAEAPPSPAPTAEELTATLMMFDENNNGKLEKSEVPERLQGMFERGDTDHNGVLTRQEIAVLAEANRQAKVETRRPGGLAFNSLDKDQDGEISAAEIANAVASLKTLDKNGDGQITEDELAMQPGGGRGPGGTGSAGRGQ